MRKMLALFLLSFYLLSNTQLKEAIKLPALFEHYKEHKAVDNRLTLLTYLYDHYSSVPHTDNDEARDNQLPFKSVEFNGLQSPAITSLEAIALNHPVFAAYVANTAPYRETDLNTRAAGTIWQPPKLALPFQI